MAGAAVFAEELWIILQLLLPQIIQVYFTLAFGRMTLAFVGNYDPLPDHIGGAALGSMYSNVTGMSIGIGATLAVGTFCSQNNGRGAAKENGIVLRHAFRAQVGSFAFAVAAALVSWPLLGALGQPEELLGPCFYFSLIQALGMPPAWLGFSINSALNSQSVMKPGVAISIFTSLLNVGLTWLLLSNGVGYLGVAIAFMVTNWVGLAAYVSYVVATGKQGVVWRVPERPALSISFRTYANTCLPSAASMWVEWWAAEILALFAGLLPSGQYAVAANGILFNTLAIVYFTYVSTQVAATVRIGNLVGARDAARIPPSLLAAVSLAMALSVAGALVLQVFGQQILRLYTSDEGILDLAMSANPGVVLSVPPYSVMMCLLGAMRSAGLQTWGAGALFVAFYVFGIPSGAFLGLVAGWDLLGVWAGNVVALTIAAVAMSAKIFNVDWPKAVEAAMAYEDKAAGPTLPPLERGVSSTLIDAGLGAVSTPVVSRASSLSSPLMGREPRV